MSKRQASSMSSAITYRECVDDPLLCIRMDALGALTILSGVTNVSGMLDFMTLQTTNLR